ncbi:hypothetical protein BDN71DRAFT_1437984 [Pleurotus eryngii]|uniref:WHIM1 domain-containing protein n=1 Tax=Pleurotus eryngii TaxID=5323 RepID=A0A9P6AAH0_PLEER|nr:hypothetical protein BDN71DRAFT_1437984 [Pleurotus eryngii]
MAAAPAQEKKPHICPPSTATHPSDRWETMFVYSFICKFTNLRGKVEGLESPMDLEAALLSPEASPILVDILGRFIRNLRPQTRNIGADHISSTISTVMAEYFKSSERSVFWDEALKINVDPFHILPGGFFAGDWDFKLKILRQLVELQLCHSPEIKATIDHAWGVVHNKHKKKDSAAANGDPDFKTQDGIQLIPIGQDMHRKRFWVIDDSPRLYVSTNPWKMSATFQAVSSSKEEYLAILESLKEIAPKELKKGERRSKLEQNHIALVAALEARIPAIDTELARVSRVRKRIENKRNFTLLSELRETRTRRQTRRPDYVYSNDVVSDDDADEYVDRGDENYDEEFEEDDFLNFRSDTPNGQGSRHSAHSTATRRSTRTAAKNVNGKREAEPDAWEWRGERRSTRRLAHASTSSDPEPPYKRAKTEDSVVSTNSVGGISSASMASANDANGIKVKKNGAAAVKPTEVALEQVAGRKRSKFWYYAVEPIPNAPTTNDPGGVDAAANGVDTVQPSANGVNGDTHVSSPPPTRVDDNKAISMEVCASTAPVVGS